MSARERPGRQKQITAFGETKSLRHWAEDSRCSVAQNVIAIRLGAGYSPEDAISAPMRPGNRRYEAFGESKLLVEWQHDVRCKVTFQALYKRLKAGESLEEAMSRPMKRELVDMLAFGEWKRLKEWLRDPRCLVLPGCLYTRLQNGMGLEEAMTKPLTPPPKFIPRPNWEKFEAFGESKTCEGWSGDSRCVVSDITLRKRLKSGMAVEEAITMTIKEYRRQHPPKPRKSPLGLHAGFGEKKTFNEWFRDPRCIVSTPTIMKRVKQGMSIEEAITTPVERPPTMVTAFGETKSVFAWALDSRAVVCEEAIRKRLVNGFLPEAAITHPSRSPGIRAFWNLQQRGLEDEDGRSLKEFAASTEI